jgi:hypothetical protein
VIDQIVSGYMRVLPPNMPNIRPFSYKLRGKQVYSNFSLIGGDFIFCSPSSSSEPSSYLASNASNSKSMSTKSESGSRHKSQPLSRLHSKFRSKSKINTISYSRSISRNTSTPGSSKLKSSSSRKDHQQRDYHHSSKSRGKHGGSSSKHNPNFPGLALLDIEYIQSLPLPKRLKEIKRGVCEREGI